MPLLYAAPAPEHRGRRHQAAFGSLDGFQVACTASLARHAVVGRIHKPDVFGALAIQQRIGALWIGARWVTPQRRVVGKHMRFAHGLAIRFVRSLRLRGPLHARIAAMTVRAAQGHGRAGMHAGRIRLRVATLTAGRLAHGLRRRLRRRRCRRCRVFALFATDFGGARRQSDDCCERDRQEPFHAS